MLPNMHIVNFEDYCPTCDHHNKGTDEDPCEECMEIAARPDSHKPEYYKKKEDK